MASKRSKEGMDLHGEEEPIEAKMQRCQVAIEYQFHDQKLLQSALTHASSASNRLESNERMEFLGDSVLGTIVCQYLYERYPEFMEGELTKIKSIVVSRRTCAKVSISLGLERCLVVGKGMQGSVSVPRSLLSDLFESLIAAIYLDGGWDAVTSRVLRWLEVELKSAVDGFSGGNHKSTLQQWTQRDNGNSPSYELLEEKGPDHNKLFLVAAVVEGRKHTPAWGRSKKEAEQRAAGNALAEIHGTPLPFG
jgi:ribonuclease-3